MLLAATQPAPGQTRAGRPLGQPLDAAGRARAAVAPPVVLISGMMAEPEIWANWATSLARDGYRVFVINTPSWGFASVEEDLAVLRQAIDGVRALTGAAQVQLVGHSKGGIVALEAARRAPREIAAIVTISTPHRGVGPAALGWIARAARLGPLRIPVLLREMSSGSPWVGKPLPVGVPVTSIYASYTDGLVTSASARLGNGRDIALRGDPRRLAHWATNVSNVQAYEAARAVLLATSPEERRYS
jgi:pimeloyl-ACP methyl ester carboxylesterase